jgi:hypothetical protein
VEKGNLYPSRNQEIKVSLKKKKIGKEKKGKAKCRVRSVRRTALG